MAGITTSLTPSAIGSANIAGLGSGIDFNSTVDKLIAVEKQRVSLLQTKQQLETNKQTALNTLNGNLTTLQTAAQALSDSSQFFANTTTLTSSTATDPTTLLKVTLSSTAAEGTHTIKVTQLAAAEKIGSGGGVKDVAGTAITSATATLQIAGSFTVQGQATSAQMVTVTSTDSLQDIANNINTLNAGSNATGVTASILQVSSNDFRLILTADNTGLTKGAVGLLGADLNGAAPGALSGLNLGDTANLRQSLQAPLDANLTIDTIAITRDSNIITDALSGSTLTLLNADATTTITMATAIDQTAIKAKIQSFVDAFNTIKTFINKQMAFDTKTQTNGILASDSTVRAINSQLSNSILTAIPGLPSGSDSMVLFGVAPDSTGQLVIDDAKLTSALSTNATAVRDVFAATGTSSVSSLVFIAADANTVSGTYAVDITTAAAQASVTGNNDLVMNPLAASDTVTITDNNGRQAVVTLAASQALSGTNGIVDSLNTEFAKTMIEVRGLNSTLLDATSGSPASSTTNFNNLKVDTTAQVVNANDTITINGTKRGGGTVKSTFIVLNPSTDTLSDLLSAIQVAFDQQVTASVDGSGNIAITDNSTGDSSLSLSLTANNEGAGSNLNLGVETTALITEGRYALDLKAAASGNFLQIQANGFGPSSNFTVKQNNSTSSDLLGLGGAVSGADFLTTVANGANVAGTIGGLAATGSSQSLTGSSGNVNGLTLLYTGNTIGAIGNMSVSLGSGFLFSNLLDTFTNTLTGLMQSDITASKTTFSDLQTQINDMNARIEQDRVRLTKSFQQMETLISSFKAQGDFLSQQIGFSTAKR